MSACEGRGSRCIFLGETTLHTIRYDPSSAEYQPALLTYAWKSYSRFVNTGAATRTRPFRLSPVRLQEKENPSLFVRLPPEYRRNSLLDEIRPFVERAREQSQLFDNGAANFPIKTFIHPFIHSVELVYIERRSTKFQQMANSWLFLPPPPPPPLPPSLQVKTYTVTRDRSETRLRRSNGASNFLHPSCSFQPVVLPFLGRGGGGGGRVFRRSRTSTSRRRRDASL